MNRRFFLKSLAASGMSAFAPSMLKMNSLYSSANAAVNYAGVNVVAPAVMPQVINIFLYGGPSELSGNLTNIVEINDNSQNSYTANTAFGSRIISFDDDGTGNNGLITPHGFWRGAGGLQMQHMLDEGMMSVYRTIFKQKDPTRSHRESILMSLKGSLDIEMGAGVGTRLASMMLQNRFAFEGGGTMLADDTPITDLTDPTNMTLPFVSFEGETRAFALDPDFNLPIQMRYQTLDSNFDNPYNRNSNSANTSAALDGLVAKIQDQAYADRYRGVVDAFDSRVTLDGIIGPLATPGNPADDEDAAQKRLPSIPAGTAFDADRTQNGLVDQISYPNNRYSDRVRAAVTLALEFPSSVYITVGGGLGGWDDHNNGVDDYPDRMQSLFETLQAAMWHIKYSGRQTQAGLTTPGGKSRNTDNIIINVFGDFGRRVNLNNSMGWDHGNNQNLWTFGGSGVRGSGALGKVIGSTVRVGDSGSNDQYTEPADTSYSAEPMSIASSVYSYFGAQNPQILTADPELNVDGDVPLDEGMAGELPLF